MPEVFIEIWRRAISVQPAPSAAVVAGIAALALAGVMVPVLWPLTRHVVTMSHEGGHAFAAVLTGRKLAGIRLHSDTSGLTVSQGRPAGPGMVIMLAAGYLAPAVTGVVAALLLAHGRALGLLWLLVIWLSAALLKVRNAYGFVLLLGCGLAVAAASLYLPVTAQSGLAYLVTWVLLIAAPKPLVELAGQRRRGRTPHSDVDQLARLTRIPGVGWLGLFLVLNLAGLTLGVVLLLPSVVELARSLGVTA